MCAFNSPSVCVLGAFGTACSEAEWAKSTEPRFVAVGPVAPAGFPQSTRKTHRSNEREEVRERRAAERTNHGERVALRPLAPLAGRAPGRLLDEMDGEVSLRRSGLAQLALLPEASTPSSSFATPASSNFPLWLAWVPPLWALLLVILYAWRAFRRRCLPKRIRLPEADQDGRPRQKSLFAVFVEDEDILAAADGECNDIETTGAMREAVLPPTPLAVFLIPLVETLGWLAVTIFSFTRPTSSNGDLLRLLSFFGAWVSPPRLNMAQRSHAP